MPTSSSPRSPLTCLMGFAMSVALVAIAIAIPTYVRPQALKIPLDTRSTTVATGTATVVDTEALGRGELLTDRNVPVRSHQSLRVIEPSDDHVITVQIAHRVSRDDRADFMAATVNATVTRMTIDRRTGYPKIGANAYLYDAADKPATAIAADGLQFKFPFNTQQHDYRFYDVQAGHSYRIEFRSVADIDGLQVYYFRQEIPIVDLMRPVDLPAAYFGGEEGEYLRVNRYYSATREVWVEPTTGMVVDGRQIAYQYLSAAPTGASRFTLIDLDARWDDATRAAQLAQAREASMLIRWGLQRGPWVCAVVAALVLSLAAIGMYRHQQRREVMC